MSEPNYESKWWGYIYDQMMMQDLQGLLDNHLRFYHSNLRDVKGPVLECACGTGLFLLPLLIAGHEMHGFDISISMLAKLKTKAEDQGLGDIDRRISVQDFVSFRYEQQFEAIILPTNTFLMLTTQESQITTLKNIYAHLRSGGKLFLDLKLAGMRGLVESPEVVQGRWHTWTHPETGRVIRQRVEGRFDFNDQLTLDRCFIEYENQQEEFLMTGRWIFKDEFQLLLRLAGFEQWQYFSTPDRDPLEIGLDEAQSYWIVDKA
ncbi:class I SAM-dependent DNA methyltransferase [Chloroflexota bacterium]